MYANYRRWAETDGNPDQLKLAADSVPREFVRVLENGVIFVQSARYDPQVASYEVYVKACEHVLSTQFDASSSDRATVLIDMQLPPGCKAAKYSSWHGLSVVKHAIQALGQHYPGRLERMVIYPVSNMYRPMVSMAMRFMHPNSRGKIQPLYDGNGWQDSLVPYVPKNILPVDARGGDRNLQQNM